MPDLVKLKTQFLEYLEIERGRSVKTVENYDRYLDRFFDFAEVKKPSDLTEEQVREFRLHLNRQPGTKVGGRREPMKRRTQNYYLIALRAFLKYLRKRDIEALSPERIELAKVPERSLDLISGAELKRLMKAPDTKTLEGKRDSAILELLFSTGLVGHSGAAIGAPRAQTELQPAVIAVAGVDLPVATRLALCDPVPGPRCLGADDEDGLGGWLGDLTVGRLASHHDAIAIFDLIGHISTTVGALDEGPLGADVGIGVFTTLDR